MRVTQSMIARNIISNLSQNRENLNKIQTAISTGKEFRTPSSDPVEFSRNIRFRTAISDNNQYLKTITDADSWLSATSSILNQMYEQIEDAKEISIQGADESNSATVRSAMAIQINGIIDELFSLSNSNYIDKHLFSGTETQGDVPFSWVGDTITYNGDTGRITRRITKNHSISININGQQLMDSNMFTAVAGLKAALETNDVDAVRNSISELSTASQNMISLTTSIGSIENQIAFTQQRLETANLNLSSLLSKSEDVDMTKVITQYNAEELSYRAALQSASNVMQLNLMQFLK